MVTGSAEGSVALTSFAIAIKAPHALDDSFALIRGHPANLSSVVESELLSFKNGCGGCDEAFAGLREDPRTVRDAGVV